MKYMGSKARHARELLPIILADRKPGQFYVEPFVGGANMIDKVGGPRIGSDMHPHLMEMWTAIAGGWLPREFVSEADYADLAKSKPMTAECGYVGFALSFGGKFFGGYRRDVAGTKGCIDNMKTQSRRAYDAMVKQSIALQGVTFKRANFLSLDIPANSIIYCDPPYAGTTKYATGGFDHTAFWKWCDDRHDEGHTVFVSEYAAPDHWECVWEKRVNNTLTKDTGSKQGVERLFRRTPQRVVGHG